MRGAFLLWALLCGVAQAQVGSPVGAASGPAIGSSLPSAIPGGGDVWWPKGPLITRDANAVAHVYWRAGALVDAKGNSWSPVGSPAQVGASGAIPPGAGPLSGSAYYTASVPALNFAGDFTAAIVGVESSLTGTFGITLSTGNGSVGHLGAIVQSPGNGRGIFYPSAAVNTANTVTAGQPFVFVYGRNGSSYYARLSGGSTNRSTAGTHAAGANAAVMGQLAGNSYPGTLYEVYATTTPFTDALAAQIITQVGARLGRSLNWSPSSSSVTPGAVVALGDSITEGTASGLATPYPSTLATDLGAGWSMTNAGVPNDRVDQMATRWTASYKGTGKKWVVLLGGVNDIINGATTDVVIDRLLPLYESILKDGARRIPVTITPWKTHASWTAGRQTTTDEVNAWIAWWCTTNNVPYVDAYNSSLNDGAGNCILCQADGIHPTQAGANYLESIVRAKFP